jgi:ribosome-binding factor A
VCSLGRLRTAVGKFLGTKYCPELAFRYDTWTPHVEVRWLVG